MLNRLVLIGRLTKDPELRHTPNGKATCDFTLAIDRKFKNAQGEKETDFINCKVPPYKDKLAELCAQYLSKGKLASIDGSMQVRTYNDSNGQKHWVTEAICEDVHFLSPKDEGAQTHTQQPAQNNVPPYGAPPQYGQPPAQHPPYQQAPYQQPPVQQPQGEPPYPGQYAPPGYAGQPPSQGYQQPPQGYMPPPPGYQGQAPQGYSQHQGQIPQWLGGNPPQNPPGATPASKFGHQVNINPDDIPF
ncbi:single-stranded DNA-binding protein [Desulfosporosinus fructosivorans]|uniref:Single-stranded DNA-binding protein n=1 Tax=Desulfosporosinus fructosivorans TaxID=2018669 RepID=A0A4Z0QZG7_9FIRM|nr:single-stranded DNA-binding protein [Desulfosporosinus fructosivorans]TGE35908.1 single-stranded DNA-binding protein [Desulfosporosinus fructosivorans]